MPVEQLVEMLNNQDKAALLSRIAELRTEISDLKKTLSDYQVKNYELYERIKGQEEQEA